MEGTFTCGDDACAHEWDAELVPLWVPTEWTPHCPECGTRGWLLDVIVLSREAL